MGKSPEVSISTLSVTPPTWKAALRRFATAEISTRMTRFKSVFPDVDISASLHPGRNVNVRELAVDFGANGITMSDIDIPEVKPLSIAFLQAVGSGVLFRFSRAKNHIGWALTNVGSGRQQRRMVREGLEATKDKELQIVRTHAAELNTRRGRKLVDSLVAYKAENNQKKVALALEITADKQTPQEYNDFIKQKQQELSGKGIQVYMDLDLGHIARSGNDPLKYLQDVLADPVLSPLVKFVTFNQYVKGEKEAHARLDAQGQVKFQRVAELIREKSLKRQDPIIMLFEPHPSDFDWLISSEGKDVFNGIISANR